MTKPKDTLTAKDVMHKHVQTVKPDTKLADIIEHLLKHEVSNVPVVEDDNGQLLLIGFISEADCMEHLANELFYGSPAPVLTAELIMKRHPVCVGPDTNIFTLVSVFISHRLRHLPVVENQHLLGIVSRRDVLQEIDRYYREATKLREEERNRPDLKQIINHRFIMRNS